MEVIDMEVNYRNPKIYLLSGKARHGKDTIAGYLKEFYEKDGKKVIFSRAGKYIKFYAMEMTGWDGSEETKPRTLLQELGTDVIRNKLNKKIAIKNLPETPAGNKDPLFFLRKCENILRFAYYNKMVAWLEYIFRGRQWL